MGCWESACCGTHVWNVTANSPVRHETSETHANDRIENRLREPSAGRCQRWREDLDLGGKFWRRALWYSDTKHLTWSNPTNMFKKSKKTIWLKIWKTTFVLPLSHSLPWHSVGRCDCWLGVAEILQIMHSHLGVQKNTSELVTQKTSSVANATRLHNSKIGWGFHTTLLRCTVGKFQLTNPSAKLWQNENCDFPTSDLQETRWAFAQFRLPLNLRLQHRRLELPLPLFYSKRLIQWLDLTVCHFVEMNGYIQ